MSQGSSFDAILAAAVEMPDEGNRNAYLERECGGDEAQLAELRDLVRVCLVADSHFNKPSELPRTAGMSVTEVAGTKVGRYRLIEKIGEGGMGVVYAAEQTEPVRRNVALKIIKPGMDSRQIIARFEGERQALAMMEHPHIAKVLDGGTTDSGRPYFVMELVRGLPITDHCDQACMNPDQRLALFVKVCQAVQHAHQKGIIHRDLKPSNVLVTTVDGMSVPKVIDFGLAKALYEPLSHHTVYTPYLQIVGTPLYMSPEQAEMRSADVDTRSDVYSLGVLLYELLTGTTPFVSQALKDAGIDGMRRILREEDPPCPSHRISTLKAEYLSTVSQHRGIDQRRLSWTLRGELDWIVMKALDKLPDRRYQSASDLAEDIERYLQDVPIVARPYPRWLRLRKWFRRHPLLTISSAVAIAFFALLAVGGYWHNRSLSASLSVAERLRKEGLAREQVLRQDLYATDIHQAAIFVASGKKAEAIDLVERYRSEGRDVRGLEWDYLWNTTRGPLRTLSGHTVGILTVDVSPDDRFIASGDEGGTVNIWNRADGTLVKSLKTGSQEVTCVRFSPDGQRLATAGQDRKIRLWTVGSWTESHRLEQHERTVTAVAWSPDGSRLASSGRDSAVYIWNCSQGKLETSLPAHTDVVRCLAWSKDGKWLATADVNRGVLIWETANWNLHGVLSTAGDDGVLHGVLTMAFSPDSRFLAYGGYGGSIRVAEISNLLEVAQAQAHSENIWSIVFLSPDNLAVGTSTACRLLQFNPTLRKTSWLRTVEEQGRSGAAIASSDSQVLVVASYEERTINLWSTSELLGYKLTALDGNPIALAPSAELIAIEPYAGKFLNIRRLGNSVNSATFRYDDRYGSEAVFSPDGRYLAFLLGESADAVAIVATESWQIIHRLPFPGGANPTKLLFSRDGGWLAMGGRHCLIGAWNTRTAQWHEVLPQDPTIAGEVWETALAFSPTEDLLAATRWNDQKITLWRPENGTVSQQLPVKKNHSLAFSPDGNTLAAAAADVISLWDIKQSISQGKLVRSNLSGDVDILNLAFSPDGRRLAGASSKDSTIRLWDVGLRRELMFAKLPAEHFYFLSFRNSGQLAVGCGPGSLMWFGESRDDD